MKAWSDMRMMHTWVSRGQKRRSQKPTRTRMSEMGMMKALVMKSRLAKLTTLEATMKVNIQRTASRRMAVAMPSIHRRIPISLGTFGQYNLSRLEKVREKVSRLEKRRK